MSKTENRVYCSVLAEIAKSSVLLGLVKYFKIMLRSCWKILPRLPLGIYDGNMLLGSNFQFQGGMVRTETYLQSQSGNGPLVPLSFVFFTSGYILLKTCVQQDYYRTGPVRTKRLDCPPFLPPNLPPGL